MKTSQWEPMVKLWCRRFHRLTRRCSSIRILGGFCARYHRVICCWLAVVFLACFCYLTSNDFLTRLRRLHHVSAAGMRLFMLR